MEQTIADVIRERAHRWVDRVSLDELAACLPVSVLTNASHPAQAARTGKTRQRKAATKKDVAAGGQRKAEEYRPLTPEEAEMIRSRLGHLEAGTPEFKRLRNELVSELNIRPHQVSGALRGRKKAAAKARR